MLSLACCPGGMCKLKGSRQLAAAKLEVERQPVGNSAAWDGRLDSTRYIIFVVQYERNDAQSVIVKVGPAGSSEVAAALQTRWNEVYGGATRPVGASWVKFEPEPEKMAFYDASVNDVEEIGAHYKPVHDTLRVRVENH